MLFEVQRSGENTLTPVVLPALYWLFGERVIAKDSADELALTQGESPAVAAI